MKKLIALSLLLVACQNTVETNEVTSITGEGIQGEWTATGELEGGFNWFSTYTFDDQTYALTGYPPIDDKGTYEILNKNENTYTLSITPESEEPYQIVVELLEDGKTLDLNGQTYTRVK